MTTLDATFGAALAPFPRRAAAVGVRLRRAARPLPTVLVLAGDGLAITTSVLLARPAASDVVWYAVSLAVVLGAAGAYRRRVNLVALTEVPVHVSAAAATLLVLGVIDGVVVDALDMGGGVTTDTVVMAGASAALLPLGRWASYSAIRALRRRRIVADRVLVVGADPVGTSLARALERRAEHGMQPVGFVDDIDPAGAPAPLLGELSGLDELIGRHGVQRVIVAFGSRRDDELIGVLRATLQREIDVYVVPRLHELGVDGSRGRVETVDCIPLQRLRPAAPTLRTWPAKRGFDIVVAASALLVLAPLLAALALGVRLSGPGPVLFRQLRVGQHGQPFQLLKFRTLRVNDDSDTRWSVAGDDRQTRIGRLMRRFSLDELPQLWNVVVGDMALIGPRPERPHFVEEFSAAVSGYGDRHRLPVGLTGWAQVNGLRGDTSIAERARFDNHYIDHWSLLGDLSILVATAAAVVRDGRSKRSA